MREDEDADGGDDEGEETLQSVSAFCYSLLWRAVDGGHSHGPRFLYVVVSFWPFLLPCVVGVSSLYSSVSYNCRNNPCLEIA